MDATQLQRRNQKHQSWAGVAVLIVIGLLYCWSALTSPFWNGYDTWSNILPVIHYRQSILEQHSLPLYTGLWYGGRAQWANPLWNFLYLPSTLVWLALPLDWGTRVVFFGHLVFSLLVGRTLAALFLKDEAEKVAAAIIFTSPVLVALTPGQVEKVMSWGWALLALYCLLRPAWPSGRRGVLSGLCLAVMALTGSNYYTFYAGILLLPFVVSYRDIKLFLFFLLGSSIGLLHLPSVWHLVGQTRIHADVFIDMYSMNAFNSISALAVGYSIPPSWEKWTPVGIPIMYMFVLIVVHKIRKQVHRVSGNSGNQEYALLFSITLLLLLSSGLAYRVVNWFDLFRTASRALAFVALAIALYVFMNLQALIRSSILSEKNVRFLLFISAVQILASAWMIRPEGSSFSPCEDSVQRLADILKADHAKSVWRSDVDLDTMYIDVGLTRNHIALPNVYYGDMGQQIQIQGPYCGYSFDHLLASAPVDSTVIELYPNTEWSHTTGEISLDHLHLLEQIQIGDDLLNVYRVVCKR